MTNVISICVCHHTGDLIYRCLDSIRQSKSVDFEIIVIADEYRDYGEDVRVVTCTDGPAYKRNLGFKFCKGDYIAFLDDDTELDVWCLNTMLREVTSGISMTYSKLLSMSDRVTLDHSGAYLGLFGFLVENLPNPPNKYILSGKSACCMISREAFIECGMFDRDFFMFGEETDLSWRLWLKGYKVSYCQAAICYHAFNTPLKNIAQYYSNRTVFYHGSKNYPTMLIKNLGSLWLVVLHLACWLFVWACFKVQGKSEQAKYIREGLGYLWTNRRAIKTKRAQVQATRTLSDRQVFRYIKANVRLDYYLKRLREYISQGRSSRRK